MDPARMFKESLTSRPELENSLGHKRKLARLNGTSDPPPKADIRRKDKGQHETAGDRIAVGADLPAARAATLWAS